MKNSVMDKIRAYLFADILSIVLSTKALFASFLCTAQSLLAFLLPRA